jgi:hypothetical protein
VEEGDAQEPDPLLRMLPRPAAVTLLPGAGAQEPQAAVDVQVEGEDRLSHLRMLQKPKRGKPTL